MKIAEKKYIEITQEVVFKDMHGAVLKVYPVGALVEYTVKVGPAGGDYFVTAMGGIWTTEARAKP